MCVFCVGLVLQRQQTENNKLQKEGREMRAATDILQVRGLKGIFLHVIFLNQCNHNQCI